VLPEQGEDGGDAHRAAPDVDIEFTLQHWVDVAKREGAPRSLGDRTGGAVDHVEDIAGAAFFEVGLGQETPRVQAHQQR
jgi:hypothetical protein